jgi:uncharacterized protein YecE (DUF72 family)
MPYEPEQHTYYRGTSGWSQRDWAGKLYPLEMPFSDYLETYGRHFPAVEIEHTFYDMPTPQAVQAWYRRSPDGFQFCPCLPRRITHELRLQDTDRDLHEFISTITGLQEKLGPILLQLPENFRVNEQPRLADFLATLPQDIQFAIEFRHGSWLKDSTYGLLNAHHVAWVVIDAPFLPRTPRVTADVAYVRWHGYPGVGQRTRHETDPAASLRPWVTILRDLARQAERVYGFVRNSYSGYAPRDGTVLLELLGEGPRSDHSRSLLV